MKARIAQSKKAVPELEKRAAALSDEETVQVEKSHELKSKLNEYVSSLSSTKSQSKILSELMKLKKKMVIFFFFFFSFPLRRKKINEEFIIAGGQGNLWSIGRSRSD